MTFTNASHLRLILFDYGGVIADHYSQPYMSQLGRLVGASEPDVLNQLSEKTRHGRAYRLAQISLDVFWDAVRENLKVAPFSHEAAQLLWAQTYIPNAAMLELVSFLRNERKIKVGLILNEDEHRLRYVLDEIDASARFDFVFASCDLGAVKPDPSFYENLCSRCDSAREREKVLVVDDRETHVSAPRAAGFQGYLFKTPGEFSTFITDLTRSCL